MVDALRQVEVTDDSRELPAANHAGYFEGVLHRRRDANWLVSLSPVRCIPVVLPASVADGLSPSPYQVPTVLSSTVETAFRSECKTYFSCPFVHLPLPRHPPRFPAASPTHTALLLYGCRLKLASSGFRSSFLHQTLTTTADSFGFFLVRRCWVGTDASLDSNRLVAVLIGILLTMKRMVATIGVIATLRLFSRRSCFFTARRL